ncbi:MAG TPA: hypothetical protein VMT16_07405 [Thermoanaerobaculia bacterium]|nr:hypothetical protein [Thermoanaerobaculia bacterium]
MTTRAVWTTASLLAVLAMGLAEPVAARGPQSSVRFRLGLLTPEGDSRYWDETALDFSGKPADFEDVVFGVDYLLELTPHAGLLLSLDHFEGEEDQRYLDFVDAFGAPIVHTTTLEITPLTAGLVLRLAPARSPIAPYVGAGGGIYFWRLEEAGDFIDFSFADPEIFSDRFVAEGQTLGYYLLAGVEVPLGPYFSFLVEGRWDRADDDLGDDFQGLGELDLSGRRIYGGIAWRF